MAAEACFTGGMSAPPLDVDAVAAPAFALVEDHGPFRGDAHAHRRHQLLYARSGTLHLEVEGARWLLPPVDAWLTGRGLHDVVYRGEASDWPVWAQIVVALLVIDLVQWCVHNLLHRVPWLWEFHKCHHSVADGEMDWIVSFRFQWTEVVVYKLVQYLPLAWFGFGIEAVMVHAIFGTFIGHLNHANLNWDWGPLRYVLNSPRMHIWHHDYDGDARTTVNYGIIFSLWDWMFGTAKLPAEPPRLLGFEGVEAYPRGFFGHLAEPFRRRGRVNEP